MKRAEQFLYLTTKGWKTGALHRIEIWYVQHNGRFYLVSQYRDRSAWVQNIKHDSKIDFHVGNTTFHGIGRIIEATKESVLAKQVSKLMDQKYDWSDGLIVELRPEPGSLPG